MSLLYLFLDLLSNDIMEIWKGWNKIIAAANSLSLQAISQKLLEVLIIQLSQPISKRTLPRGAMATSSWYHLSHHGTLRPLLRQNWILLLLPTRRSWFLAVKIDGLPGKRLNQEQGRCHSGGIGEPCTRSQAQVMFGQQVRT